MIRVVHLGSRSRIRILIFYPSRIPDPGVKKALDPGSGSGTLEKQQGYALWYFKKKIFFHYPVIGKGLDPSELLILK
jgi:hypothetical protein